MKDKWSTIPELIGKTFHTVETSIGKLYDYSGYGGMFNNQTIEFHNKECKVIFGHIQDCCELVTIKQIDGDLKDLENSPILQAEVCEVTVDIPEDECGSQTATFYKFATNKGYVTVQWLGESNGCYSESVNMVVLEGKS